MSERREWTAERHAAAKARCDAASKGPWTRCGANDANCRCGIVWGHDPIMVASVPYHEDEVGGPIAEEPQRLANWRFIEEARIDLPDALREIERLKDPVDGLEAKLVERTAEREEARDWVRRLTREQRVLTCAFCGAEYPPGTPESNDAALTAHVRVCPKHPMRETEAEIARLKADLLLLGALKSEEVAPVIARFREAFGADVPQAPSGKRTTAEDMRERAAQEAERALIEYAEIDVLDKTPERIRIARRIRALPLCAVPDEPFEVAPPVRHARHDRHCMIGDGVGCSREPGCEVER